MESRGYLPWRELTLRVRTQGAYREEMVTIGRVKAGLAIEFLLQPFVAATMR